jgi:2-polyprenyl-6-methoxyphenol hydroxylase-like FAD-dependent oxidoreductase
MIEPTTVAIVGAGPTGLLLAGDLAHAGVDVTVLERRGTESNLTRAFGVHARTLEHLDAPGTVRRDRRQRCAGQAATPVRPPADRPIDPADKSFCTS